MLLDLFTENIGYVIGGYLTFSAALAAYHIPRAQKGTNPELTEREKREIRNTRQYFELKMV